MVDSLTSPILYSLVGDGAFGIAPDPPMAFMYNPATVGSSRLQEEFVPMKKSLVRVLRSNRSPVDPLGYRNAAYPAPEARAVIQLAFIEMLGREPQENE